MENEYVVKQNKRLRRGYTTGTCAAAAAKASAMMLLSGSIVSTVTIKVPKGIFLTLDVIDCELHPEKATCAIRKDSGDDPDITDGVLIYATVQKTDLQYADLKGSVNPQVIQITGGQGVGRVTKPGLACKIGEAAINPIPMGMIRDAVDEICTAYRDQSALHVTIFVPEGEAIAKKTFNPRLGIVGGISILGTTGIVEPMSESALIDTIHLEMNQRKESGDQNLLVCPGNYGERFAREQLGLLQPLVLCSNYVGEMLDFAVELSFRGLLLIGHAGKLVKLAAGIMNTHSRYADCRMEVMAVHASLLGANTDTVREIMECVTTEQAVHILDLHGIRDAVFQRILVRIDEYMQYRVHHTVRTGAILFTNEHGLLGISPGASQLTFQFTQGRETEQT